MHENIHMSIIIVHMFDGLHKFKSSTNCVKLVDFLATYVNLHVVYYIVGCCAPFAFVSAMYEKRLKLECQTSCYIISFILAKYDSTYKYNHKI